MLTKNMKTGKKPAVPAERGKAAEFEAGKHLHFVRRQLKRDKQFWMELVILEPGSFRREAAGLFSAFPSSSFNAQCALHPPAGKASWEMVAGEPTDKTVASKILLPPSSSHSFLTASCTLQVNCQVARHLQLVPATSHSLVSRRSMTHSDRPLGGSLGAFENEGFCPAASGPVTVAIGSTVCSRAQGHG